MDELYGGFTQTDLSNLWDKMSEIRGSWNGKESGKLEERCQIAGEIQELITPLKTLLDELRESYS